MSWIGAIGMQLKLPLQAANSGEQSKAAGIFPADLARVFYTATRPDWELVRWSTPPDPVQYLQELNAHGGGLLLGE